MEGQHVLFNYFNLKPKHGVKNLMFKFLGPLITTKVINNAANELEIPEKWQIHNVCHTSLLKLFEHDGSNHLPKQS
jgi:hypothetical protein